MSTSALDILVPPDTRTAKVPAFPTYKYRMRQIQQQIRKAAIRASQAAFLDKTATEKCVDRFVLSDYRDMDALEPIVDFEPDDAEMLMQSFCTVISLPGVERLKKESSDALFGAEVEQEISPYRKNVVYLNLPGIKVVDANLAESMGEFELKLFLDGVEEFIDEKTPSQDSYRNSSTVGDTSPNRLTQAIEQWKMDTLSLRNLKKVNYRMLKSLCLSSIRNFYFDGIEELSCEEASAFGLIRNNYNGTLSLNGLKSMSVGVARGLANAQVNTLSLCGLSYLFPKAAEALANSNCKAIYLNGLTSLDLDAAKALSKFKGKIFLNGITWLDPEVADALFDTNFDRVVKSLENVNDPGILSVIIKRRGVDDLPIIENPNEDIVTALSEWKGNVTIRDPSEEAIRRLREYRFYTLHIEYSREVEFRKLLEEIRQFKSSFKYIKPAGSRNWSLGYGYDWVKPTLSFEKGCFDEEEIRKLECLCQQHDVTLYPDY